MTNNKCLFQQLKGCVLVTGYVFIEEKVTL